MTASLLTTKRRTRLALQRLESRDTPSGPVPVGPELRVNTYTTAIQGAGRVAIDTAGDFVVVWTSLDQDGDNFGIFAQRYSAAGTPLGGEFQVNTYTTDRQRLPAVAMDANGDFTVVWNSENQTGSGGGIQYDIYAQRYNSAGSPQGGEFLVNTVTTNIQYLPAVASDASGNFVVVWSSSPSSGNWSIEAQRFSAAGVPQGGEFRVDQQTTAGYVSNPHAAMSPTGEFVISWDGTGIRARRYDSAGIPTTNEFLVAGNGGSSPLDSCNLVICPNDDLLVAYMDDTGLDGSAQGIFVQRFNAAGTALGSPVQANTWTTGRQEAPSLAVGAGGNFVVSWQSFNQDTPGTGTDLNADTGVYAQMFNASGLPLGGEFRVNTYTTGGQWSSSVAMNAAGQMVIDWMSYGQDGDQHGVYAQRYQAGAPRVQSLNINNGAAQRSRVTQVQVNFDSLMTLPANPADAFQLRRQSDNALVGLTATATNDSTTHVTLTFTGALSQFGSLQDGRYTVRALATQINGGDFDGNGDGTSGDDYTFNFHRLFGDADGNGIVTAVDFNAFRLNYGAGPSIFDFDNDGQTSAADFAQFYNRYGIGLP